MCNALPTSVPPGPNRGLAPPGVIAAGVPIGMGLIATPLCRISAGRKIHVLLFFFTFLKNKGSVFLDLSSTLSGIIKHLSTTCGGYVLMHCTLSLSRSHLRTYWSRLKLLHHKRKRANLKVRLKDKPILTFKNRQHHSQFFSLLQDQSVPEWLSHFYTFLSPSPPLAGNNTEKVVLWQEVWFGQVWFKQPLSIKN